MPKHDDTTSKQDFNLRKAWNKAHVANLMAVGDPTNQEVFGAFAITDGLPLIFSRLPREDYEVGDADIRQWKMVYTDETEGMMGDYFKFLNELDPYILDEQNNSVLLRPMSTTEITEIFEKIGYDTLTKDRPVIQE